MIRTRLCSNCGERYDTTLERCPTCATHRKAINRDVNAVPPTPCAHQTCAYPARVRVGSANLCEAHYLAHHQAQADAFCQERVLDDKPTKQVFIRERLSAIGKPSPSRILASRQRSPGDDDEELEAA